MSVKKILVTVLLLTKSLRTRRNLRSLMKRWVNNLKPHFYQVEIKMIFSSFILVATQRLHISMPPCQWQPQSEALCVQVVWSPIHYSTKNFTKIPQIWPNIHLDTLLSSSSSVLYRLPPLSCGLSYFSCQAFSSSWNSAVADFSWSLSSFSWKWKLPFGDFLLPSISPLFFLSLFLFVPQFLFCFSKLLSFSSNSLPVYILQYLQPLLFYTN